MYTLLRDAPGVRTSLPASGVLLEGSVTFAFDPRRVEYRCEQFAVQKQVHVIHDQNQAEEEEDSMVLLNPETTVRAHLQLREDVADKDAQECIRIPVINIPRSSHAQIACSGIGGFVSVRSFGLGLSDFVVDCPCVERKPAPPKTYIAIPAPYGDGHFLVPVSEYLELKNPLAPGTVVR
jgi:hypothetical protein